VWHLPAPLREIYEMTDGLQLPFAELHTTAEIRASAAEPWLEFGYDGNVTHYLIATDGTTVPPIAAYDPETNDAPEGAYASVLELLEDEYSRYVDNDQHSGDLHVTSIPADTALPGVVQELKHVASMPSGELLKLVRTVPFIIDAVHAATAIGVVRRLHALGVVASLQNVRNEDTG
jgi:hypothetical protein